MGSRRPGAPSAMAQFRIETAPCSYIGEGASAAVFTLRTAAGSVRVAAWSRFARQVGVLIVHIGSGAVLQAHCENPCGQDEWLSPPGSEWEVAANAHDVDRSGMGFLLMYSGKSEIVHCGYGCGSGCGCGSVLGVSSCRVVVQCDSAQRASTVR